MQRALELGSQLLPLGAQERSRVGMAASVLGRASAHRSWRVSISATGARTATATSDSEGHYTLAGLAAGRYTVVAALAGGYVFSPASLSVTISSGDLTGQDFAGAGAFSISGAVSGPVKAGVGI